MPGTYARNMCYEHMLKAHKIFKQKVLIFHFADNLSVHKINIFFLEKVEIPRINNCGLMPAKTGR
jgi:hypothetical protein